jgi:hypothetical protein
MPLISNNIIVGTNLQEVRENKSNIPVEEFKPKESDKEHHILVVNGKSKKVAKRSQYFLDMFTLDDD